MMLKLNPHMPFTEPLTELCQPFLRGFRVVLMKCLREGLPTDMTVYDAAALSAIVDLSCQSVARRGRPVDVPDFTRGRWRTLPPLDIVRM